MPKLTVDGREIETPQGTCLLTACLRNDIYIPNLCYLESMELPLAACRLCFVQIEGNDRPLPSCTVEVQEGMRVQTETPAVRRLQRQSLRLLLSVHRVDCARCPANKQCALQRMAKHLKVGLKPKRLEQLLKDADLDDRHPCLDYYPNRCVLCGRCVHLCRMRRQQPLLTFAKRGFETIISFYGVEAGPQPACSDCNACVESCPVSALLRRDTQADGGGGTAESPAPG